MDEELEKRATAQLTTAELVELLDISVEEIFGTDLIGPRRRSFLAKELDLYTVGDEDGDEDEA